MAVARAERAQIAVTHVCLSLVGVSRLAFGTSWTSSSTA
jgi:hypothetical protein